jgi:tRNA (uracil-5-)-methyltransferase TRM9
MKRTTIQDLIKVNQDFYQTVASSFDKTRQNYQPGWQKLIPFLPTSGSVLDVGCGNGRFGEFLKQGIFEYTGIDSNQELLDVAKIKLPGGRFINQEITQLKVQNQFDLVVCFGVLHHIPGFETRINLLNKMATLVKTGGCLSVSLWQFGTDKRLMTRTAKAPFTDLEPGDYLLKWQDTDKLRYCHYVDVKETEKLKHVIKLKLITDFEADGKTGNLGRYLVWQKDA